MVIGYVTAPKQLCPDTIGTHVIGWLFQAGGGTNGGTTCSIAAMELCTKPMPVDNACFDKAIGAMRPADAGPFAFWIGGANRHCVVLLASFGLGLARGWKECHRPQLGYPSRR